MPWKHNHKILKPGTAWTDSEGRKHGKFWHRNSAEAKKRYGIVWEDDPISQPFDNRFYHGRKLDGTLIPKSLTDVNVVDDDGKAVIDPVTKKQQVILGLKSTWIAKTKATANNKLSVHDWMVVRKMEKSTAIPSSVTTYRDAVRTKCAEIETALNNAADLAAFIKLFEATRDSNNKITASAKINDWPDEI